MLTIENLKKNYDKSSVRSSRKSGGDGPPPAVDDVSFEVKEGELFTLLGPSGCGKTTTLRCIAGLERPDSGVIRVGANVMFGGGGRINVPISRRGLGIVFQSYAIWPHMSVFRNVSFPLDVARRHRRLKRTEVRKRVRKVLEMVELAEYEERPATKLSGGQQQRLALARAVVTEPDLLLLDEPLSNLDAKLRESMRLELKRLQRELGATTVYVTHDQGEALALSSRIAVMNSGKIVQVGTPREVYTRPSCRFAAEFVGTSNFIEGTVTEIRGGLAAVRTNEGILHSSQTEGLAPGMEVVVSVRPETIEIFTENDESSRVNEWRGTALTRAFAGDSVDYLVKAGQETLRVRCNPAVSIPSNSCVYLSMSPDDVVVVP